MTICTIPGCQGPIKARDLCSMHYQRDLRTGTPYRRPVNNGMIRIVRQLERLAPGERISVPILADRTKMAPGSVRTRVSHIRKMFGFTVIDGSPSTGYRLGEWPGRNIRRARPGQPPRQTLADWEREEHHRQPADADGVVVTEAGRRLGL